MNIESGTWESHKAGSNHLKQAIRKGVPPDVDPQEGANDQGEKYCQLCKLAVKNSKFVRHIQSAWHLKRKGFAEYQAALNNAEKDKNGIVIDGKLDFGIVDFTKTKKTVTRPIVLKATATNGRVKLTDSKLVSSRANMDTTLVSFILFFLANNKFILDLL
jgi:helicase MOV-10